MMNLKKIYYLVLCALVACTTASCKDSNDDYIPPALEPEKPEVPVEPEDPRADVPIHVDGEPYTTYKGLLMTGYQGWFGTPGDGCSHANHKNTEWYHYRENDRIQIS